MAKRTVIWTKTAQRQRREILKYWTIRNGSTLYAEKLIRLTKERLLLLLAFPEEGRPTNHKNTRVAVMGNYNIYYSVTDEYLIVKAFWDNRQNPDKLVKILNN